MDVSASILVCSFSDIESKSFPFEVYFCSRKIQERFGETLERRIARTQQKIDQKAEEVGELVLKSLKEYQAEQEKQKAREPLEQPNPNMNADPWQTADEDPERPMQRPPLQQGLDPSLPAGPMPFQLALPKGQDFQFEEDLKKLPVRIFNKDIGETEAWDDLLSLCTNKERIQNDLKLVTLFTGHIQALVKPFCREIFEKFDDKNDYISQKRILNDLYKMENDELKARLAELEIESSALKKLKREHSVASEECSRLKDQIVELMNENKKAEAQLKDMERLKAGEKELNELRLEKKRMEDVLRKSEESKKELENEKSTAQQSLDERTRELGAKIHEYNHKTEELGEMIKDMKTKARNQEANYEKENNKLKNAHLELENLRRNMKLKEQDFLDKKAKEQKRRQEQTNPSEAYLCSVGSSRVNGPELNGGLRGAREEMQNSNLERTVVDSRGKSRTRQAAPNVFGQASDGLEAMEDVPHDRTARAEGRFKETRGAEHGMLYESMGVRPDDNETQPRIGLTGPGEERSLNTSRIIPEGESNTSAVRVVQSNGFLEFRIHELESIVRDRDQQIMRQTKGWRESETINKQLKDELRAASQQLRALQKAAECKSQGLKQGVERIRNWNNLRNYCCCFIFLFLLIPLIFLGFERSKKEICNGIN